MVQSLRSKARAAPGCTGPHRVISVQSAVARGHSAPSFFVDHFHAHSAVDDDVLTGHESRMLGQEQTRFGDVVGCADPSNRMLLAIAISLSRSAASTRILPVPDLDPPRTDA